MTFVELHPAGLPVRRRQPESLPIVANGVFGARDMDTIAPLSSPKVAGHDNVAWAQAEPTPELPHKKLRRGRLFGRKSSGKQLHLSHFTLLFHVNRQRQGVVRVNKARVSIATLSHLHWVDICVSRQLKSSITGEQTIPNCFSSD